MWFGALGPFQTLFFHTPLVHLFVAGSEAYHDYYRWRRKDSRTFDEWCRGTDWGKLFQTYAQG